MPFFFLFPPFFLLCVHKNVTMFVSIMYCCWNCGEIISFCPLMAAPRIEFHMVPLIIKHVNTYPNRESPNDIIKLIHDVITYDGDEGERQVVAGEHLEVLDISEEDHDEHEEKGARQELFIVKRLGKRDFVADNLLDPAAKVIRIKAKAAEECEQEGTRGIQGSKVQYQRQGHEQNIIYRSSTIMVISRIFHGHENKYTINIHQGTLFTRHNSQFQ